MQAWHCLCAAILHKNKTRMQWVADCECSSAEEKKICKDKVAAAKVRKGPAGSSGSQLPSAEKIASSSFKSVRCLRKVKKSSDEKDNDNSLPNPSSPFCVLTVSDYRVIIDAPGRCDDSSDESFASNILAERAVVEGIGMTADVDTVLLKMRLTEKDKK